LRIIAQDPSVKSDGKILTAHIELPAEDLAPGPWGYRVHVIDYDATSQQLFWPISYTRHPDGFYPDPFEDVADDVLLNHPSFHGQNVYAIAMRILSRFEYALGRRVSWNFATHQLKIAPHAFCDANAFYSRNDESLMFGYFPSSERDKMIYTCLSHDVVAHESTHALLDGLRDRFIAPSSPDQAAFHEGFSDVVALLSTFALEEIVAVALSKGETTVPLPTGDKSSKATSPEPTGRQTLRAEDLTVEALRASAVLKLAEQMGEELSGIRGKALRHSATLPRSKDLIHQTEFREPHRRGEILVAAVMDAFLNVWSERLVALDPTGTKLLDRERVVEEGAKSADHLLTICIRGLDFTMPVHIEFGDFLSAVLTADHELYPDDHPYYYRKHLRASFAAFGILPASARSEDEIGIWYRPDLKPSYDRIHFESLTRDDDEMFRFIWENRRVLSISEDVFTKILSVRPCMRIAPDGFALRETVAEYIQMAEFRADELPSRGIRAPRGMPPSTRVMLEGGGTLVFDEFGRLKFHINNRLDDRMRQSERLEYLWQVGFIQQNQSRAMHHAWCRDRFAALHRMRRNAHDGAAVFEEGWH
jgi:hypothetical protein